MFDNLYSFTQSKPVFWSYGYFDSHSTRLDLNAPFLTDFPGAILPVLLLSTLGIALRFGKRVRWIAPPEVFGDEATLASVDARKSTAVFLTRSDAGHYDIYSSQVRIREAAFQRKLIETLTPSLCVP